MSRIARLLPGLALAALSLGGSFAATTIAPLNKFAWGENIGWTEWRTANSGASGVAVAPHYLTGFIWAENVGWINVGAGPENCARYDNRTGEDFGVNIRPNGDLDGLAWGENIGWINFDTRDSLAGFGQQARFDFAAGRFRGYVWGENIGWINLDHATHYIASLIPCEADLDGDGYIGFADLNIVVSNFNTAGPCVPGDVNGDQSVLFEDLNIIVSLFNTDCQ